MIDSTSRCPSSRARSGCQAWHNKQRRPPGRRQRSPCADRPDLHERDPRGIVDADMDELPTDAVVTVDRARISPGDAVSHRADPAELFDIEMDKLAWVLAFITPDRFSRLQGTELVQSQATQNPADGGWRDAGLGGDLLAGPALPAQPLDLLGTAWGVGRRSRCGRDDRSCNPLTSLPGDIDQPTGNGRLPSCELSLGCPSGSDRGS